MIQTENPQQFIQLLKGLRAVRQFRPEPIPQEVVDVLLDVARWSGTASNRQHWEIVVVQKRETLQALAQCEGYAQHLAGAALGIALVMAGDPDLVDQETYDEGRLSERLMLAAEAYGVGSCIGWLARTGQNRCEKSARYSAGATGTHDYLIWLSRRGSTTCASQKHKCA